MPQPRPKSVGPHRPDGSSGDVLSCGQVLTLVRHLAVAVEALHQAGRTHRAIETVRLDAQAHAHLGPPAPPRRFGAGEADPEYCPPELAVTASLELPAEIPAALEILRRHGLSLDPRRIDVYQLGVWLYQQLTGQSIASFIYDPLAKAGVPDPARPLLGAVLGYDSPKRYTTCRQLIEALDNLMPQMAPVQEAAATPPAGRGARTESNTPTQDYHPPTPAGDSSKKQQAMRFERLGPYRILELIGHGGMGDVFRAYDEALERQVAVKVLPAELARDEDFVRRFHDEATAMARVSHPNVVQVFFSGEAEGQHFFAMQLIEGQPLSRWLAQRGRLTVDESLTIIEPCLAGLETAHAQGLIHRDVKPGNILLEDGTGRPVLIDFGLVHRGDRSTRITVTGIVLGTADYLSPEQARGQTVDGRADIYSLGVLWYQLLSGRLPFEAETPTAMMFQHAYEEPFPLAEAAPELPQPIVDIIERMMAKDPDARNASCTAVRADVRAFCEGRALSSRAPAVAGPVPKSRAPAQASKVPRPVLARPPRLEPWDDEQFMASLEGGTRQGPWHRLREFAVTLFRRHAPEIVKNLQSTTQQVESALADYERRRNRLAQLRDEARSLANELSKQVRTQEAALEKKEKESLPEESLAEEQEQLEALRQQRDEQAQSLEGIEQQFIRADGTLARLRSQNSSLKARLRAAQASQAVYEQEQRTGRWRRWPLLAVAGAAMLGMLLLGIIFFIKYRGADGRTRELTVGVSTTSEKTTKGSSEQGSKPGETLPARYRNSLGMEFVLVPRGKFWMGGGNGSLNDAKEVEIPYEFYVGVYEVTQDEWQTITGTNPSWFSRTGRGKDKVKDIPDEELKHFPVENVSWSDAQLFLQALNAREKELGWVYRLPKAAEWEYACRGGPRANKDEYGYNFYLETPTNQLLPEQANFAPELGKALQRRTSKVGSYKPNSLGLYDMHGNVWEWGDDEDRNSEGLSGRVSRGGSWSNGVGNCLAATRGFGAAKDSAPVRGLRLARVSAHSTGQIRTISEPPQGAPPSQPRQETIAPAALPARYRNNLSMEFALVPRGKFWMGGGNGSLTNAKEVEIPYDFYLGVFEVTQEEWQTVMGDNPSSFSRNGAGKDKVRDIPNEDLKRFPVENVSWNDAQVFLKALNAREKEVGWVYRLSRGAEWEYACRGGPRANKAEYGYDFYVEKPANQLLPGQANFAPEPGKGLQRTCKVGSFTPNSLGLYDMHGNVWEWGDDEDSNAEGASGRVSRGGSFSSGALGNCRAATRGFAGPKDRLAIRGLRLARVPAGLLVAVTTPPPDKPTPPQTNIPVTKPAVPVTAVADVDRKAAEWVLSIGGQVTIRPDNQPQTFAINRNLPAGHFQVLEVYLNGNYGFSSAALVNLKGLTNLKRLDLWLTNASDTGLAHLKGLTNLTHLSLSATHVTNDGLIHLKNLTNLRQLILTHTRVSDAGLVHLKDLSNLQELWLGATLLSDAGLVHLGGLTNLRFLSLGVNTQVTDAGLIHLKGLTNLKDLNLSMTQLTDAGVPMLASLGTRLDKLSVEGTHISAKGFATLRAAVPGIPLKWTEANRDLATLALSLGGKVHIRMKGQKEDRPIKDLSEIPVDYFQVTRLGLADLKHLPEDLFRKLASLTDPTFDHLEMLDLSGTPFQDRHLEWVFMFRGRWFDLSSYWPVHRDRLHEPVEGEFTHLVDLSLAGTQISDAGLAHLHDLKALKRLVLSRCQISGPGLAHLKKLPNLAELHLGSSLLTTPDLQVVSDLKKLERLNLAGSSISDEGLKHLHGLTNLQELDLRQTKVTAAAKATLQKVLPKCRIL